MDQLMMIDATLEEMKLKSALRDRVIPFIDDFTTESCYKVEYLLKKIVAQDKELGLNPQENPITIEFKSYGGEVYPCYGLISLIEELKEAGYQIIGDCTAYAMSCGFLTFISCSKRIMSRYATIMCHQLSGGTIGELQTMIETVESANRMWDVSKEIILKNTKITEQQLEDMKVRKYDWYMNVEEAIELGCVDQIK